MKPQILSVLGDVALAIGPEFRKYLDVVLQTLIQASQAQVDRVSRHLISHGDNFDSMISMLILKMVQNDFEMVDYLCELREGVLECYTGIVQGLRGDSTGRTADLALLEAHLPDRKSVV